MPIPQKIGGVPMDSGNTTVGSGSLNIGDMNQAWINTSEALEEVQADAGNNIEQNSENQERVCHAMLTMSNIATTQANQSYNTFLEESQAEKHVSFWHEFFVDFVGALTTTLSLLAGQPELAAISIALLVGQQTGGIGKMEKAICPNSALGRLLIGVSIMAICLVAGGVGAAVRDGSAIGGGLLAGSQALGSVGIQANIAKLLPNDPQAAFGIACGLMVLALIGGFVGGKLSMQNAKLPSFSFGEKMAVLSRASAVTTGVGMAGQSSSGIAGGDFKLQEANALESANKANATSNLVNALRDVVTDQGKAVVSSMEQVATTAAKEGVAVAKGMAKCNQWAAQLMSHGS